MDGQGHNAGALLWSGDIDSSFEAFRNQVNTGLNVGLAGLPWWTTDIGGFHGGDPKDPEFRRITSPLVPICNIFAYFTNAW